MKWLYNYSSYEASGHRSHRSTMDWLADFRKVVMLRYYPSSYLNQPVWQRLCNNNNDNNSKFDNNK